MPENKELFFSALDMYGRIEIAIAKKDINQASNILQELIILLQESWARTKEGENETYYHQPLAFSIISEDEEKDINYLKQCYNYAQYQSFKNQVLEECEKNHIIIKHLLN